MNNSTLNFTPETSTDSTDQSSDLMDSLYIGVYIIGFTFGLPTHSYIIWLIIRGCNGVALEIFNLNLSVCEIGVDLHFVVCMFSYWFLTLVQLKCFMLGITTTGRPLFQCLICVERYLAVVHPVIFLKTKPLRYRVICCAVVWIFILGSCMICMVTANEVETQIYSWYFPLQFLVFFCIQMFCLVSVLRALKESGPGERRREKEEENHMKRRAFQIILITTGSMTVTYGPYVIIGFFTIRVKTLTSILWLIGFVCYVLGTFVQPVLYLQRAGKLSCLRLP